MTNTRQNAAVAMRAFAEDLWEGGDLATQEARAEDAIAALFEEEPFHPGIAVAREALEAEEDEYGTRHEAATIAADLFEEDAAPYAE